MNPSPENAISDDAGLGESPWDHLELIVRPNMVDFEAAYGDIRRAFNAIAAVDALAGHMWRWCHVNNQQIITGVQDDSGYRHHLAQANVDFALVRDMAKAQKHIHLTRGNPQVSGADQIETRSLGWGQARWGEGRWGSPPQVVVETDAGEVRVVKSVLGRAVAFLESELERIKLP